MTELTDLLFGILVKILQKYVPFFNIFNCVEPVFGEIRLSAFSFVNSVSSETCHVSIRDLWEALLAGIQVKVMGKLKSIRKIFSEWEGEVKVRGSNFEIEKLLVSLIASVLLEIRQK